MRRNLKLKSGRCFCAPKLTIATWKRRSIKPRGGIRELKVLLRVRLI